MIGRFEFDASEHNGNNKQQYSDARHAEEWDAQVL